MQVTTVYTYVHKRKALVACTYYQLTAFLCNVHMVGWIMLFTLSNLPLQCLMTFVGNDLLSRNLHEMKYIALNNNENDTTVSSIVSDHDSLSKLLLYQSNQQVSFKDSYVVYYLIHE